MFGTWWISKKITNNSSLLIEIINYTYSLLSSPFFFLIVSKILIFDQFLFLSPNFTLKKKSEKILIKMEPLLESILLTFRL